VKVKVSSSEQLRWGPIYPS